MKKYKYLAFAKINLFLLVYRKKQTQEFHKIDGLFFKFKDLYDEITISLSTNTFHSTKYTNIKKNTIGDCIILKTLKNLTNKKIISNFYNISVKKMIPIFSGLGGASSDLAIVLKHISYMEKIDLNFFRKNCLIFSSDLLFFLHDYNFARIYGYGNKIKEIKINTNWVISLIPNTVKCSTRDVFKKFDSEKYVGNDTNFKQQMSYLKLHKYEKLINDLKLAAFDLYPDLKKIYYIHSQNSKIILMTGSGSTFFTINN